VGDVAEASVDGEAKPMEVVRAAQKADPVPRSHSPATSFELPQRELSWVASRPSLGLSVAGLDGAVEPLLPRRTPIFVGVRICGGVGGNGGGVCRASDEPSAVCAASEARRDPVTLEVLLILLLFPPDVVWKAVNETGGAECFLVPSSAGRTGR
jgi:hypothetical protein